MLNRQQNLSGTYNNNNFIFTQAFELAMLKLQVLLGGSALPFQAETQAEGDAAPQGFPSHRNGKGTKDKTIHSSTL